MVLLFAHSTCFDSNYALHSHTGFTFLTFLRIVSNPFPERHQLAELHGYTVHQRYQTIYNPTNAHNVKNVDLLKQSKIKEAAPTCFGLQGNDLQGVTVSP